jgi:hypothetical protein
MGRSVGVGILVLVGGRRVGFGMRRQARCRHCRVVIRVLRMTGSRSPVLRLWKVGSRCKGRRSWGRWLVVGLGILPF